MNFYRRTMKQLEGQQTSGNRLNDLDQRLLLHSKMVVKLGFIPVPQFELFEMPAIFQMERHRSIIDDDDAGDDNPNNHDKRWFNQNGTNGGDDHLKIIINGKSADRHITNSSNIEKSR